MSKNSPRDDRPEYERILEAIRTQDSEAAAKQDAERRAAWTKLLEAIEAQTVPYSFTRYQLLEDVRALAALHNVTLPKAAR